MLPKALIDERYQVLQLLKQAPGLTTCLALDQTSQQEVVLKELRLQTMETWDALKLFQRETQILKQLNHPQIPTCLASFHQETNQRTHFYLVTERVPGQSLQAKLDSGWRADEAEARKRALQILDILAYLHSLSPPVIHRDLKPGNLVEDPQGNLHLIDFGAVQTIINPQGGTTIAGTFGFMPPEQYLGQTVPASDLYALGATLLQLMVGSEPADWPLQGLRIDLQVLLPDTSAAWRHWLEKMLEPELESRYLSVEMASQALLALPPDAQIVMPRLRMRRRGQALHIDIQGLPLQSAINANFRHWYWTTGLFVLMVMLQILLSVDLLAISLTLTLTPLFIFWGYLSLGDYLKNRRASQLILTPQKYTFLKSKGQGFQVYSASESDYLKGIVFKKDGYLSKNYSVYLLQAAGSELFLFKTRDLEEVDLLKERVEAFLKH